MKRVIVCISFCTLVSSQAQSQNMDIDLLRKFNSVIHRPDILDANRAILLIGWRPLCNQATWLYGLCTKTKKQSGTASRSALSVGICLAVSGGVKTW